MPKSIVVFGAIGLALIAALVYVHVDLTLKGAQCRRLGGVWVSSACIRPEAVIKLGEVHP